MTHLDAIATAAAIRGGEQTAREVAEAAIAAIEQHNPALNAVVGTRFEEALAEIDAGLPVGPLTGVPILIKNLGADVAGLPSTQGSRLFADYVPEADSELVRRYKAAGMVVLGTTNAPEFGLNGSTEPALFGPTHNPWGPGRSSGGSSGGSSSAVAAAMVPVAHGNDGGGSIRIPAATTGLFGLKPSRGRVSKAPDPSTLSAPVAIDHALTTTVRDSALLLDLTHGGLPGESLAAPSPVGTFLEAAEREPGRLRIGLVTELVNGPVTDPQCVAAARAAAELCERLGHTVEETGPGWDSQHVATTAAVAFGAELVVGVDDWLAYLGRELREDDVEPFTRFLLEHYRPLPAAEMVRGLRATQEIGWQVGAKFHDYDVLLTPTLAIQTPPLGLLDTTDIEAMYEHAGNISSWTSPFNVTGMPAMSVPLATAEDGMPIGVQFVADLGREELLFSLAGQLEQAAPWQHVATGYAR